jgi:uncharacterized protein (DUF1015 family)
VPRLFPFVGLTYDDAVSGPLDRVTAPPYDVISDARRRAYLTASPFSVVHLDLAEGSDDPEAPDSRYARAAHLLEDWERRGAVRRGDAPAFYGYEMSFPLQGSPHTIRGLFAAMELEPWGGRVIPHERTMPGPVEDRLRLLRATRAHLSAVYGTIAGPCRPLADLLDDTVAAPPPYETLDEQGVRHRMWPVPGGADVGGWLAEAPLLVADGHHRYTTALAYRHEQDARQGPGSWDRVLTLVVDAATEHLPVLPFHRVQTAGTPPAIGDRVSRLDDVLAALSDDDVTIGSARREGDLVVYRVARLDGAPPAVRALHETVLDGAAPDGSLRFVPDAGVADAAVVDEGAPAAWFLPATTPERIRAVVERGERLPQKSTYFWPKPRTGMVMMPLDA